MGLLSKIRHKTASGDQVRIATTLRERDDRGTRHDSIEKASAYWMTRISMPKKDPFVMHTFDQKEDARSALLELKCIEVAEDTNNLICTEILIYGYWRTDEGTYEAVICGDELSYELWEQARESFARHGGRLKNELEPEDRAAKPAVGGGSASMVKFVREDRQEKMGATFIYRIHKAPDGASAQGFLAENPVTQRLLYLIVETPQGNYCRDIDGIYKE